MRYWVIACAFAAVLAASAGAAQTSARNGRIGYLRPLGGNEPPYGHLFAVNADGNGAVDLTSDGRWLAFVRLRNGNQELYKVRANGRGLAQLTNTYGITEASPAWQRTG
jgi:hypothetical protein